VDLADRERVLLASEREDDELAGGGFGGHGFLWEMRLRRCPRVIGPSAALLSASGSQVVGRPDPALERVFAPIQRGRGGLRERVRA
jgi:hypothetical protein